MSEIAEPPAQPEEQKTKKHWFARQHGPELTSLDLLKCFAVPIMVIDHIGSFFFVDDMWWRAVGRVGFPIWFFLIGYARGRDLPMRLIGGAILLVLVDGLTGYDLLPVNALVTIILMRITLRIMDFPAARANDMIILQIFIWSFLILFTYDLFEYGTLAFLFGLMGYFVRNNQNGPWYQLFFVYIFIAFMYVQVIVFEFAVPQAITAGIGTAAVIFILSKTKLVIFPNTGSIPVISPLFRLMGRYTLEIYIIHLTAFGFLGFWFGLQALTQQ
ncbi:MAG: hypothetical protein KI792_00875 [Alphaproteobacteria bacterium]|nr:hypothetical protein [Alphaproteobacteria bacterium SS10]